MKKIVITTIALSALVCSGCDSLLNKQPIDQFTDGNFWSSETNVETFANRFYDTFSGYSGAFYFPTLNDNQGVVGLSDWNYKSVPAAIGLWTSNYQALRRANLMIERIPGISSMSDASKNNWIGVARLYRALKHYELVRAFGDIIYVDKLLDVTDSDKNLYLYGERQDRDVVMDKVLEDLNFAVANINMNAGSRTAFNNAVAQAIKSEICLYEGTFCKYRSTADGQKAADNARAQKFLTESKTASKAIMDNTMYSLNASYQGNYNSVDLAGNKEMILYKKYLYGVLGHSTIDYTCSSTMQNGMSKAAFESYLFTDGKPLATTSLDKTDHPVLEDGHLSIKNLLAVRDPRLSAAVDPVLMYKGNAYARFDLPSAGGMETSSSTGYGVYKFDNDDIEVARRNQTGSNETDAPIFWLANIYVNYAEACAELGNCTQADLDASVNKLRDRVGMPHLTTSPAHDTANNMGVSDLIWEVRRERRVELMYDNDDRYWCLIRWHQLDKLDTSKYPDQTKGAYIAAEPKVGTEDCAETDANGYISFSSGKSRLYESRQYLYPIPSGQIDLYQAAGKTLTQNPGWE